MENEKITGTTSKAVKKIKWVRMYKAFKSGPHLVNTSPFVFVIVVNMFGDERKDNLIFYMSITMSFLQYISRPQSVLMKTEHIL